MHTHENDLAAAERANGSTARRDEGAETAASLALSSGRPETLPQAAVLHLQRAAGNAGVTTFLGEDKEDSPVKEVIGSGGGRPLDEPTRGFMESRMGADFGDVRIHTDSRASESAKSINAQAYTVGADIAFQSGKYEPESDSGKRMIAHELTHVIQQKSGPVDGTPAPGGISISDPSDRFEQDAERNADHVMSAEASGVASTTSAQATRGVQRQEEEQDDTAQASFVQRQEEEERPEEETAQGSFAQRQEEEEPEEQPSE